MTEPVLATPAPDAPPGMPLVHVSDEGDFRKMFTGTTEIIVGMVYRPRPNLLVLEYITKMMSWLLLFPEDQLQQNHHAVQLGLGCGAITRFCLNVLDVRSTAVELNPHVISACREWFDMPEDSARLRVVCDDAAAFVKDPANRGSAQSLQVDLYDHVCKGPVLDDVGFYRDCYNLLTPGGALSMNVFGSEASAEGSIARIAEAFGPRSTFCVLPGQHNSVLLVLKDAALPDVATLTRRAEHLQARFEVPALDWLRQLHTRDGVPVAP
jgi:spermidine synthase